MATMPIEIIVQDAEVPVVPSKDGTNNTETNITVPDTGTISSNGETSSSASSIILPAILLVLAIGSIVAILIHRYSKHKTFKNKVETSKKEKLAVVITSTIAMLAATVLVGNLVIPATKAATSDVADGIVPAEDKVSIVVTRDGGVAEASIESTATITSTSDFGYTVLLSMAEGVETTNLYLNGDVDSEYFIAPVEAEESTELTNNTWGYASEEGANYTAVPLQDSAVIIAQGDEPVEDEALSIYYGVKVSSNLPTGTYSGGEIEYSLQASTGFPDSLVYMQDMTSEICAAAPMPGNRVTDPVPTATLEDTRDHNTYTIAKLADGKCWMTQNLDLDLKTDGTITYDSTNTNLPANTTWVPERATITKNDLSSDTWHNDSNNPYSYDPGDVYYYALESDADDIEYESLEACIGANHTESDCKHYHAGNYYNWTAAIASNDSSEYTERYYSATNSICPKGWRLPIGRRNSGDMIEGYEQGIVISDYNGIIGPLRSDDGVGIYAEYLENGLRTIRLAPLWLSRFGAVDAGALLNLGDRGNYWSNTVNDEGKAFGLTIASNFINPPYNGYLGNKYFGYSIRCVAE